MRNKNQTQIQKLAKAVNIRLHPWRNKARRLRRAWRYATGHLSMDTAQTIILDCEPAAGWHPLLTLTVDDTLDEAIEEYRDHPELPRLVSEACAQAAYKWEPPYDNLYEARRYAIELVSAYARDQNIHLITHDKFQIMEEEAKKTAE